MELSQICFCERRITTYCSGGTRYHGEQFGATYLHPLLDSLKYQRSPEGIPTLT